MPDNIFLWDYLICFLCGLFWLNEANCDTLKLSVIHITSHSADGSLENQFVLVCCLRETKDHPSLTSYTFKSSFFKTVYCTDHDKKKSIIHSDIVNILVPIFEHQDFLWICSSKVSWLIPLLCKLRSYFLFFFTVGVHLDFSLLFHCHFIFLCYVTSW